MRAVISGAGAAGLLHALALRAAGVRIAGLYDPDAERAAALASFCGGEVVRTLDALVAMPTEIASVCGPPSVHVAQAELLAREGRAVFVEKPVATTPDELERLLALPRVIPIAQWRAGRAIRAVRRAIEQGELGPAPVASVDLAWGRDDAYFAARPTWGCGAVLSIGIHAIDALAWALGKPIEGLSGTTSRRAGVEGGETAATALVRFRGGAHATLRLSLDGGGDETRMTFCGRGVTAVIEGGEADPTARVIRWSAADEAVRIRLERMERQTDGALGPPLLVPFIGEAIASLRAGREPIAMTEVAEAHRAAMMIAALSPGDRAQAVPAPGAGRPFLERTSACAAASRAMVTRNGEHDT